jgi:hypothetical protein
MLGVLPAEVSHVTHAPGMDPDDLRAFLAVAESGSVTLAASRLHLSQPAVTRRLQRLEAEFALAVGPGSAPSASAASTRGRSSVPCGATVCPRSSR